MSGAAAAHNAQLTWPLLMTYANNTTEPAVQSSEMVWARTGYTAEAYSVSATKM